MILREFSSIVLLYVSSIIIIKIIIIIIIIIIVVIIIIMIMSIKSSHLIEKKCFLRLCLKVFKLSVFFNASGI